MLLGGGREFFVPQLTIGSKRTDNRDLIKEAKKAGYKVVQNKSEMTKSWGNLLLGLFQLRPLTTDSTEPSVADLTRKAIGILNQNRKGFFLMVEGSQIDWACHDNEIDAMVRQILLFDEAVKVALDFAMQDSHTIVIVTADHETGGLGITDGSLDGKDVEVGWLSKDHTEIMVPIFAFGPKAERFTGVHENAEITKIVAEIVGIGLFPE
mgnify:CR=1 FL=1